MQNEPQRDVESVKGKPTEEVKVEEIVRYYRFYKQELNTLVVNKLPIYKIPYKTSYNHNKKTYDKLARIINKYHINHIKYIKYCVKRLYPTNWKDTPEELLNVENFAKFASYLKIKEQYLKIYKTYMKTIDFIAKECIIQRITPVEYIKNLIIDNRIGYEYMSGRISKYFIASIQNFKKIYLKLDKMNKDELGIIFNNSEILNQSVQEAFLMYKNRRVKPIKLIKQRIEELIYNN